MATKAEQIDGWMSTEELSWLENTARRQGSVAEIGCWKGRSTFALLSGCTGPVYAVDHWHGSENERDNCHKEAVISDVYRQFIANVGTFPNLNVRRGDCIEMAADVPEVDMVFIDGCHTYEAVKADLKAWTPKAQRIICGHDYTESYEGLRRAVEEEIGPVKRAPGSIWYYEIPRATITAMDQENPVQESTTPTVEKLAEALRYALERLPHVGREEADEALRILDSK